jgi:hypothetical protein
MCNLTSENEEKINPECISATGCSQSQVGTKRQAWTNYKCALLRTD